eukprot:TRINITY_DN7476_c0_g1_i9.p4 TRINITY_DN7476_c0_g1~~TRINITY_DN7476_c0_g1_i9.p4  ORF type:complete len:115 (-),score=1.51 TRINITY_DN7476_c0_g1_i9:257-601(-)
MVVIQKNKSLTNEFLRLIANLQFYKERSINMFFQDIINIIMKQYKLIKIQKNVFKVAFLLGRGLQNYMVLCEDSRPILKDVVAYVMSIQGCGMCNKIQYGTKQCNEERYQVHQI